MHFTCSVNIQRIVRIILLALVFFIASVLANIFGFALYLSPLAIFIFLAPSFWGPFLLLGFIPSLFSYFFIKLFKYSAISMLVAWVVSFLMIISLNDIFHLTSRDSEFHFMFIFPALIGNIAWLFLVSRWNARWSMRFDSAVDSFWARLSRA